MFELAPQMLDRIKFRAIRRKVVEYQAALGPLLDVLCYFAAGMRAGVIEHQHSGAVKRANKVSDRSHHCRPNYQAETPSHMKTLIRCFLALNLSQPSVC